jgi:hypothetical protein
MNQASSLVIPYTPLNGKYAAVVDIKIGKTSVPARAMADTGCSVGLVVDKETASKLALGEPNNPKDDPFWFKVADGHLVAADAYFDIEVLLGGDKHLVELYVMDSDRIRVSPQGENSKEIRTLLGFAVLMNYTASFEGANKRLVLSK